MVLFAECFDNGKYSRPTQLKYLRDSLRLTSFMRHQFDRIKCDMDTVDPAHVAGGQFGRGGGGGSPYKVPPYLVFLILVTVSIEDTGTNGWRVGWYQEKSDKAFCLFGPGAH